MNASVTESATGSGTVLNPPLSALFSLFSISDIRTAPDIASLNRMAKQLLDKKAGDGVEFVDAAQLNQDSRYYETIVAESQCIPTRERHWHDAFNAMVWMLFPRSKSLINQYHVNDINQFGSHPRTPRRNRLTHYDECGCVLVVPASELTMGNELLHALAQHNWHRAFVELGEQWERAVYPVIFGHAIYEMLLNPFVGLTAKWLAVVVPDEFKALSPRTRYQWVDNALHRRVTEYDGLKRKSILKPLPLLGIPGWYAHQSADFYANDAYFRPLPAGADKTLQLPLLPS